jgi:hypothetical protein
VANLGNLNERAVALDRVRPLAAALTETGIATRNLECRRLGNDGGGWPGTFQDVSQGTDYLRQIARENRLDLNRVGRMSLWQGVC